MKTIRAMAWCGALAGAVWALGCGDDDPGPPPGVETVEVRPGTWTIAETSSWSGADSCAARGPESLDTTDVLCARSFIEAEDEDLPISCNITQNGEDVAFDCSLRINFGLCEISLHYFGGGTVTDTTFDLTFDVTQEVRPKDPGDAEICELTYGRYLDDCTLTVQSVGTWVDPGPTCLIEGADATPPGTLTIYTASVNSLAEPEYRWSISGSGTIDLLKTNAAVDSCFVTAGITGNFTLTLDVGREDCPFTCQKTVPIVPAILETGEWHPGNPVPATPESGFDRPSSSEVPFSGLLAKVLRRSVGAAP